MTADTERPAFWDDELDALSGAAIVVHGEDAVTRALERVLAQLQGEQKTVVSFAEFTAAVKAELRRLVRPH